MNSCKIHILSSLEKFEFFEHGRGLCMIVRDVMTISVQWVTPESTLIQVAELMKQNDIGSVPICKENMLVGIITDRDIVLKVASTKGTLDGILAKDIMTKEVITVTADQDAHDAARLMSKHQIRRLPVLENGKLIGILALGDLAIERIHINEAGDALSGISQGAHH